MDNLRKTFLQTHRHVVEAYFTRSTRSQYLGNNTILCKILGNKKFFAIADDVGFSTHMILDGFWEYWLSYYFCEQIKPGDTVLDIGANLGYYTLIAADLVSDGGRVLAIEPNPQVFALLSNSVSVNGYVGRVTGRNYALGLSDAGHTRPFWVPHNEPKNGRFISPEENLAVLKDCGTVFDVNLGSLNDENLDRVDFIKIDVEGAEIEILQQIRPIIEKFSPKIICEVNFARGYTYSDVCEALLQPGPLRYLDFDAQVKVMTEDMAQNVRFGEDWLVCVS